MIEAMKKANIEELPEQLRNAKPSKWAAKMKKRFEKEKIKVKKPQ